MKTKETSRKIYNNGFKKYYYKCQNCQSENVEQINDGSFSPPNLICNCCKKRVTNNPITVVKSTREQALEWWNNLKIESQRLLFRAYSIDYFTPAKYETQLTGREIEEIWLKEIQHVSEERTAEQNSYKPNQKQFKQFDESLFKAYIEKFSDLGKRKAIEILLKDCDFQKAELIKEGFNLKLQITKF